MLVLLSGCSTAKIDIISYPEKAVVEVFDPQAVEYKKLGRTPLELTSNNKAWKSVGTNSDAVSLRISKKGFQSEMVNVPVGLYSSFRLHSKLRKERAEETKATPKEIRAMEREFSAKIDVVSQTVAITVQSIQRLFLSRDYGAASSMLNSVISKNPRVAAFWDMRGSLYLVQGLKREALRSYEQSLRLQPENAETRHQVAKLMGRTP